MKSKHKQSKHKTQANANTTQTLPHLLTQANTNRISNTRVCIAIMPAKGAIEMRLSEEAVQEVFAAATSNIPAEVIHKLVESAASVFSKASKDPRECTRKLVVSHTWIMLPLTEASPSQIIHIDSLIS